jgi:uncharacterized protein (DUF697 family)
LKARISESLYGGRFEFDNLFPTIDLSHVAKSELQKNTAVVKSPSLLQIVERLERLASKLPSKIRKAVLSELTPLKQLFLQQRPPRFLFAGSSAMPLRQVIAALFGSGHPAGTRDVPVQSRYWHDISLPDRGTICILDARGVDASAAVQIQDELKYQAADVIFFLDDGQIGSRPEKHSLNEVLSYPAWNKTPEPGTKIIEIILPSPTEGGASSQANLVPSQLQSAPGSNAATAEPFLEVLRLVPASHDGEVELPDVESQRLMSILARQLPNQARMEMIRISRNREAQHEVAQLLVKSTTAICAAIGAQPIPLADLPILTSLQVMMISGIMYVSGRERSLRAATQFIGALGANLGAALLQREGTRAILKYFPGWGNVVSGLVAGSGTYAIGRAATVFFIDGVSLKDARRTYLTSRNKRARLALPAHK